MQQRATGWIQKPGPQQQGHSLCTFGPRSTNLATEVPQDFVFFEDAIHNLICLIIH